MAQGTRLLPGIRRTITSASLTGTYAAIGNPIDHQAAIVFIQNSSLVACDISMDGTNDFVQALPGETLQILANASANTTGGLLIAKGTQFYAKGTAGTGNITIGFMYQNDV